jgi:hypothetical protein
VKRRDRPTTARFAICLAMGLALLLAACADAGSDASPSASGPVRGSPPPSPTSATAPPSAGPTTEPTPDPSDHGAGAVSWSRTVTLDADPGTSYVTDVAARGRKEWGGKGRSFPDACAPAHIGPLRSWGAGRCVRRGACAGAHARADATEPMSRRAPMQDA